MTATYPLASVVIPTHNRVAELRRTLDALSRQTRHPDHYEVVVAANACVDATTAALQAMETPYTLRVLDLPAPGAAAARNAGAAAARGAILIFLDDDVSVVPEFVGAHLDTHGIDADAARDALPLRVAIGALTAAPQPEGDFFAIALGGWWEAMFDDMRTPGHRFAYTDLLTGNCSIPRAHFARLGGFDERYGCHEDYEFGYRLIEAGAQFVFAAAAMGLHADRTRLARACLRKREEGRADVQLAVQYPPLRRGLLMARRGSWKQRVARQLAFRAPGVGDTAAAAIARLLPVLESVGARASWLRTLYFVFGYWYERGLADAAGTLEALDRLLPARRGGDGRAAAAEDDGCEGAIDLDVSDVQRAERRLDCERPRSARLCLGQRAFACIPDVPGSERLAGRHLRAALAGDCHRAYVRALIDEGRIPMFVAGADAWQAEATGRGEERRGRRERLFHSEERRNGGERRQPDGLKQTAAARPPTCGRRQEG